MEVKKLFNKHCVAFKVEFSMSDNLIFSTNSTGCSGSFSSFSHHFFNVLYAQLSIILDERNNAGLQSNFPQKSNQTNSSSKTSSYMFIVYIFYPVHA